ncbi:hypothetical protein [Spirosoma foliorum]|uniref:DUF2079 domain-containing protein n=1 Tax=Spirosoma foliorum TaxID=2710596 RepID=A0A7G5GTY2_9BACT|nr:hypothetical protein [Spirosoma foliorum]QMW02324.1 hypothetical protein H3H32_31130 [Spirosoma foliorum]
MLKSNWRLLVGFVIGVCFFLFKGLRFQTLGYTFNDMYAFIQMSCSYLDGRPFMYDNIWGFHHRIHNYYTILLWGPLCYLWGAYGLFLVQASLLTASYLLLNERLRIRDIPAWARYSVLIVILLGPVAFWLNDHPNIGWHTELTYLPFALFFVLALLSQSAYRSILVILTSLLLVLVKEDGAVLAALIHISWFAMSYLQQSGRSLLGLIKQWRFWAIGLGWVAVFLIGMFWLSAKNSAPEPRLQIALAQLAQNAGTKAFWKEMLKLFGAVGLLISPAAGLLLVLAQSQRRSVVVSWVIVFGLGLGILIALNFVQSALYYGQTLFYLVSLTWPPRFVLLWAFVSAFLTLCIVFSANRLPDQISSTTRVTLMVLWLIQIPILYWARPDIPPLADWLSLLRHQLAPEKNATLLQSADLAVAQCIADQLPPRSSVFVSDYLVPYFDQHYEIWPTGNAYRPADIAIIPTADPQHLAETSSMPKTDTLFQLNAYTVYTNQSFTPKISSCLPIKK